MSKSSQLLELIEEIKDKISDMEYKSILDLIMELNSKEKIADDIIREEDENQEEFIDINDFYRCLLSSFFIMSQNIENETNLIIFKECICCKRNLEVSEQNFRRKRDNTFNKTCSECLDNRNRSRTRR